MKSLLLTLGHNSSAILADRNMTIGYEQERLDKIKSSSQFPIDAIMKLRQYDDFDYNTPVFISHWFDNFNHHTKYYNNALMSKFKNLHFVDNNFTHHDAHAWSAYSFFKSFNLQQMNLDLHYIVADGFGTNQEVLSIYKSNSINRPELIFRTNNYKASLGLMYQYATSFCDMKENQDEYKFLGYESYILDVINSQNFIILSSEIETTVSKLLEEKDKGCDLQKDSLISFKALEEVKNIWFDRFKGVLQSISFIENYEFSLDFKKRVVIAFFIQEVIERYFSIIINMFDIKNVVVSGGCFYNVKLNNKILKTVPGIFCAVPIAGDQGAAIGMYEYHVGDFNWDDLCWGRRDLTKNHFDLVTKYENKDSIVFIDNEEDLISFVSEKICANSIVNIIKGNCEMGPRALCNTSTLMLPNKENAEINNFINNRNEVMPVCPVVRNENMSLLFDDKQINKSIASDQFMILTYDYIMPFGDTYAGVMHKYPIDNNKFSGRPQRIFKGNVIYDILANIEHYNGIKAIINTSFNQHSSPIILTLKQAVDTFLLQQQRNKSSKKIYLVVYDK